MKFDEIMTRFDQISMKFGRFDENSRFDTFDPPRTHFDTPRTLLTLLETSFEGGSGNVDFPYVSV